MLMFKPWFVRPFAPSFTPSFTPSFATAVATLASLFTMAAAQAQVVFSDPTFATGPYNTTTQVVSGSVVVNVGNCASCGPSAGPALHITALYGSDASYATALLNTSFVYTPNVQGTVLSIDAQADKNLFADFIPVQLSNSFRPLIQQDGLLFAAVLPGPILAGALSTGWNTIAANGLLAAGFRRFDLSTGSFGTETPNFAGNTMTFGLLAVGSLLGGTNALVGADYANYRVVLNPVPEPQTWLMLGVGVAGLVFVKGAPRRRKAQNFKPC
jgi:PEP-CTERM motif